MKKIRVLVVDDEPLARQGIAVMLEPDAEIDLVGMCEDGQSALDEINRLRPDLVFLDVQMPWYGGLEILSRLPPDQRPAVIFVTAYDRYAVQAFELCAVDYLLKPFRDDRFCAALERGKECVRRSWADQKQHRISELVDYLREMDPGNGSASAARAAGRERMVFKVGVDHLFIATSEIAWIKAQGEFIKLRAGGDLHLIRESLQAVEKRLDPGMFIRTHRSFIVNARAVKRITPTMYGDYDLLTNDGAKLRLSRTFRDKLPLLIAAGT